MAVAKEEAGHSKVTAAGIIPVAFGGEMHPTGIMSPKAQRRIKRLGMELLGWVFLLVGIAGMVLPLLHGVLFVLIGLAILSSEYVWAHRLLQRLKARFPKVARVFDSAQRKIEGWAGKRAVVEEPKREAA